MENQLSLFQVETENFVSDIRTEQQFSKKIAYDVGVKIGGSRKDIAALRKAFEENQSESVLEEIEEFSTVLAAEIINKNELFKGFSLEQEKEKWTEPSVARAKQLLIQRVLATPVVDSKESRLQFMKAAQYLLSTLEPIKVVDELYDFIRNTSDHIRREPFSLGYYEKKIEALNAKLESFGLDNDEREKCKHKLQQYRESLQAALLAKELGLSILGGKFVNFFKKESSYKSMLTNAFKVQSWDELLTPKEKLKGISRKPIWERTLPERPDRTGGGQSPVQKPEDLLSFFGFRGVEFGHYVEDSKAMEHILRSSEAMMDLAEILGMDYKAISLNGTLGMAYGARGRGGSALAHFEPLSNVINMTKEKGCLGVFAHEWFHAADSALYNLSHNSKNGKRGFASENETLGQHIDSFLVILFLELMDVIKRGSSISYYENTNTAGVKWRGTSFQVAYKAHNGDLYKAMEAKIKSVKESLESNIRFYSSYTSTSEKNIEKLKKRSERDIKSFAQALAWYHEVQTGERVERIPYPSDKSQYFQASIALDKNKQGKYWSADCELAARAFESYIQDKLKAMGRRSDYLVAGTRDGIAFPMGEEREKINNVFEEIMKIIREQQLFCRGN